MRLEKTVLTQTTTTGMGRKISVENIVCDEKSTQKIKRECILKGGGFHLHFGCRA